MLENPGDELYFGEVYRQILQEAWLPGGGEVWSVVGKSRRGRRPTQQGVPPLSPSEYLTTHGTPPTGDPPPDPPQEETVPTPWAEISGYEYDTTMEALLKDTDTYYEVFEQYPLLTSEQQEYSQSISPDYYRVMQDLFPLFDKLTDTEMRQAIHKLSIRYYGIVQTSQWLMGTDEEGIITIPPSGATPEQAVIRRCFQRCATAWRALPWDTPVDKVCDNRWGRDYWYKEKQDRGLMCSYYDLYMRYCLRFCLDTGCIPPANYLLKVEGNLSAVECNKVYDLNFPNRCGDVSMLSGEGQFVAPGEWVSPKCGTEGDLCFQDENGSFGAISYKFTPLHWCTEFIWPDYNPTEIDPNVSKPIYVDGGVPPYTWSITGEGFSLDSLLTSDPVNTLHASPSACGTAHISVIDICGNELTVFVLCTAGSWVLKSTGICGLSGVGTEIGSNPGGGAMWYDYEYVKGWKKQKQRTIWTATGNYSGPCPVYACLDYCSGAECVDCVGNGDHPVPCEDAPTELLPNRIHCWKAVNLYYYEWEC